MELNCLRYHKAIGRNNPVRETYYKTQTLQQQQQQQQAILTYASHNKITKRCLCKL